MNCDTEASVPLPVTAAWWKHSRELNPLRVRPKSFEVTACHKRLRIFSFFFSMALAAQLRTMASSFLRFFRDHTQRHTTVGRTPLDEWSARRRDLYLTTHNTHNRQTSMLPAGFEPTISAGERPQTYGLRPRGHWDRRLTVIYISICQSSRFA